MTTLAVADIQGIILQGYAKLARAEFDLLRIDDVARAKGWLGALAGRLSRADGVPQTTALNIAFTADGLEVLGIPPSTDGLGGEFIAGIRRRAGRLGDVGASAPESWLWGGPKEALHAALLLYAADAAALSALATAERGHYAAAGLTLLHSLPTVDLGGREHFGFLDGFSQPLIDHPDAARFSVGALKPPPHGEQPIAAGEFVLGYPDHTGRLPRAPWIPASGDPGGFLARGADGRADFGRNGSFMVLRQLQQDVRAFWQLVTTISASLQSRGFSQATPEWLAAKLVGRWPRSGTPLAIAHDHDTGAAPTTPFSFDTDDPKGFGCPFGAHVRRANPRDWTIPARNQSGLAESNRHRILRRGRPYGTPLAADWDLQKILSSAPGDIDRGLQFFCFCTRLDNQFEWIHGDWLTNPQFAGLAPNTDPLTGLQPAGHTIQSAAGDLRIDTDASGRLVTVRGGGYFFVPGLAAVLALSRI
jgi:Dyp-type peroxidase family